MQGEGGTLVVLLFGWDGAARTDSLAMSDRFRRALEAKSSAYAGAKVDVWGRNMIVAAVERFPPLALDLAGAARSGVMSHREWSGLADMSPTFRRGSAEDRAIGQIRACLRSGGSKSGGGGGPPILAAVSGEPGSGKTRIVLEATRTDGLAARVVYAENPAAAYGVLAALVRQEGGAGAVLVVDECGPVHQARIWNRLAGNRAGIGLVTIYNEAGIEDGETRQIAVKGAGDEQIAEIISGYAKRSGGDPEIGKWVEYCRPSPRAAHIVGRNLAYNPRDVLAPTNKVRVWERWVAGQEEIGGEEYKDRLTVLMWLSLFTRFGFDPPHDGDAAQIALMVREHHPSMSEARFREVIRTLRATKVLQGHSILYITPRILHDYMWLKWWERYGPGDAPREQGAGGGGAGGDEEPPPPLYSRYCDMISSMGGKKGTVRAVEKLFGGEGPFRECADPAGALGSRLFAVASRASPAAALACMERAFAGAGGAGGAAEEAARAGGAGGAKAPPPSHRAAAVRLLRPMLRKRETFAGAARLLLVLADAPGGRGGCRAGGEGEACEEEAEWAADDAARAFIGAFDPAPQAGFAETPLAERLGVLDGAVAAGSGAEGGRARRLQGTALRACGAVLCMGRFSLAVPHASGFGRVAEHWRPDNRGEVCAYLRGMLDLLERAAAGGVGEKGGGVGGRQAGREAARAVLDSLAQTAIIPEIAGKALALAERMRSAGLIRGEDLAAVAERLAAHEAHRMDAAVLGRISAVAGGASRGSLHERLVRRIGREGRMLRGRIGTDENDAAEIGRLAGELARSPGALGAELQWLAGGGDGGDGGDGGAEGAAVDGRGAALLGCELAARGGGGMLKAIEDATRRAGDGGDGGYGYLLCGYLAGLRRASPGEAEDALDRMAADGALRRLLPRAACMGGGVSDRSARRLLLSARGGGLGREEALACLSYGGMLDGVTEDTFWEVVRALLGDPGRSAGGGGGEGGVRRGGEGEYAGPAALDMIHARYMQGAPAEGAGGARQLGRRRRRRQRHLPGEAVDALLHESVIGGEAGEEARHVSVGKWARLALALAGAEKGDDGAAGAAVRLAGAAIRGMGRPGIFESDAAIAAVLPALGELLRMRPREVWEIAASCIGPPCDKRASRVRSWLAGGPMWPGAARAAGGARGSGGCGPGAIRSVPVPALIEWAAEDAGPRPGRIAGLLPPSLGVAREFLARFGRCEGVAEGLAGAFDRADAGASVEEGGAGAGLLARVEAARRGESDPCVAAWLDGRIRALRAAAAAGGAGGRGAQAAPGIPLCK